MRSWDAPPSQALPTLSSSVELGEKPHLEAKTILLKVSTDVTAEEKSAEICLSPSWSDHGEKARKKERRKAEKEHKERAKKLRQDDERQKSTDFKTGKRLSKKPPPAAMETQKMPVSLRRNSWISFMSSQSSSDENSKRSSRDERRLSSTSFGSIRSKRSQSTPGTSTESHPTTIGVSEPWKSIVSPSAPKLPSFRWSSSRRSSSDHTKSASSGSDEAYRKDLIAFTYQLDASEPNVNRSKDDQIDVYKQKQASKADVLSKSSTGTPQLIKSAAGPGFMSIPYESVVSRRLPELSVQKSVSVENEIPKKQDHPQSVQSSPGLVQNGDLPSPHTTYLPQAQSSHDGSSYVHKQRMYQQQQSIAGFEDQQAIKDATEAANELAAEDENVSQAPKTILEQSRASGLSTNGQPAQPIKTTATHTRDKSIPSVYTKQRDRSTSPHVKSALSKHQLAGPTPLSRSAKTLPGPMAEHHHEPSQNSDQSVSLSQPQVSTGSKTDKILGFRRRAKQPPALVSIPYNVENQVIAIQSAPLDLPSYEEPTGKRSKIERLFREPKPAFADRDRRSSSSSSRSRVREGSLGEKSTPSHSRTRTSSSTVLNESIVSPFPKSKTEPALNKMKRPVEDAKRTKSDNHDQGKKQSNSSRETQTSHSRQPKNFPDSKSDPKIAPGASIPTMVTKYIPTTEAGLETKTTKKQAHEVIVESETGEGLIRKTSIKRPRSNPQLQTQTTANNPLPSLDFLPPLKHQPLVKRERQSPTRATLPETTPVSISQFQEPIAALGYESPNPPDLKLIPRSPLRPPSQFPVPAANRFNRSATEVGHMPFGKGTSVDGIDAKPVAKLFVICCKCKFWHDLPSKLYEAMALPLELHKADKGKVAGARLETAVQCPWCEHAMTTRCCQGWTTVVYMHERHH